MREFKGCKNYTLISKETLEDVSSTAYTLMHDKTGARVVCIQNEDENKSFMIGFKTPQSDSTGVPHILEHSVLCGSEKYPVKDALTEVSKGSLNTFMNAFTYPDKTVYPVASCNDKDFQNLMGIYLDAVFAPKVLTEPKIFMQEGWHYEMEDLDSPLTYNGVVYNEMKGDYSSPDSVVSSYILFSLFPDTQYGVESGGDPDVIPTLTYENFCNFYKRLYHPSNSRIFLCGDMDFEEKLSYIDREYLSKYEKINPNSEIKMQAPFEKRKRIEKEYSISDEGDTKDATYLSYNVVCSDFDDIKTTEAMNAINYALCSVPGAKLKERLIDAGIGKDVYSEMTNDICQKVFSIIAQGANPEDEERFVEIVESTMKEIIEEGFDKKTLEASITRSEFAYREGDYGYYPKSVAYGTMVLERWLYTDKDIFSNLKQSAIFKELREGIDNGLYEKVLKDCVLNNNHKTILIMKPVKGLTGRKEEALARKLADYKNSLTEEEKLEILNNTKALKKYQEEPDSEEALKTIPTLSLKDIKKECVKIDYDVKDVDGIKEITTDIVSNGIVYFTLGFNADRLPLRLVPALSIIKTLLGYLNTEHYTYGELVNEVNIKTGGLSYNTVVYKKNDDTDDYTYSLEVKSKVFNYRVADAFKLIEETLFKSKLDDKKRIKDNLEQSKVRIQGFMQQYGHNVSVGRASANISDGSALVDALTGMGQYRYIESILKDFDNKFDGLVKDMKEILSILVNRGNLEVFAGSDAAGLEAFEKALKEFAVKLKDESTELPHEQFGKNTGNEAFSSAGTVQYAAMVGNFKSAGLEYKGSLQVLRSILNTDYLWNQIRVLGGAYGCFCSFTSTGDSFFASYRDPNLKNTYSTFEKIEDYVTNYSGDAEEIERYIISTIADYDAPLTASMKAAKTYSYYKMGITNEFKQRERDEILATTPEEIKSLSKYIGKIKEGKHLSCVAGEEMLKKEGDVFDKVTPLITN
ncbi:MAG: insulinase family protein [Lachnospiraceae bacterium]|nr:insulinase family protein [Lachnospiraceae bacterium]